jgi:hypothetical protein
VETTIHDLFAMGSVKSLPNDLTAQDEGWILGQSEHLSPDGLEKFKLDLFKRYGKHALRRTLLCSHSSGSRFNFEYSYQCQKLMMVRQMCFLHFVIGTNCRPRFTYRHGFTPISSSTFSTDSGWGCDNLLLLKLDCPAEIGNNLFAQPMQHQE